MFCLFASMNSTHSIQRKSAVKQKIWHQKFNTMRLFLLPNWPEGGSGGWTAWPSASPTVKSSCPHRITCPINVFLSSFRDDPLACDCRSEPPFRSITWEEQILASCPPLHKSYLDHTHSHTDSLNMGIPLFNSLLLCLLIQSDRLCRFARILCFPGKRPGKAGKSLTSSNSSSLTNIYFEKGS